MTKLDADEKELVESVERGEWKSAAGGKRERARYARSAKATFRKDRRLNIRLSSKDLEAIQKRALADLKSGLHGLLNGNRSLDSARFSWRRRLFLERGRPVQDDGHRRRAAGLPRSRVDEKSLSILGHRVGLVRPGCVCRK